MVVFLDVLLLENFIVNYFLLYITSQTVRVKVKFRRLVLSAAVGAVYVIVLIYPALAIFSSFLFKIMIALLMIMILFREKNILFNLKTILIYILYSMLLAGFCIFIELNQYKGLENYNAINKLLYGFNFNYKKLLVSLIIIYLIIDRLIIYIRDRKDVASLIYTVDIISNNYEKKIKAFLDTGNELREPATNLPVMIIEKKYFNDVHIDNKSVLYIPYKVVNGDKGNLIGFKPDYIKIHYGKEVKIREVVVAFCDDKLSDLNDYNALLSRGII